MHLTTRNNGHSCSHCTAESHRCRSPLIQIHAARHGSPTQSVSQSVSQSVTFYPERIMPNVLAGMAAWLAAQGSIAAMQRKRSLPCPQCHACPPDPTAGSRTFSGLRLTSASHRQRHADASFSATTLGMPPATRCQSSDGRAGWSCCWGVALPLGSGEWRRLPHNQLRAPVGPGGHTPGRAHCSTHSQAPRPGRGV
jgi:hypothetical protein